MSLISFLTLENCVFVDEMTFSGMVSGRMGSVEKVHFLYLSSISSGSASVTRWPTAHVTMYCSPIRHPSPEVRHPITRAISLPTLGFSASTTIFPMAHLLSVRFHHSRFSAVCLFFSLLPGRAVLRAPAASAGAAAAPLFLSVKNPGRRAHRAADEAENQNIPEIHSLLTPLPAACQ